MSPGNVSRSITVQCSRHLEIYLSGRSAVVEALKPKLAKEAILHADQEMEEYLGGGDHEEPVSFLNGIEPSGDWNLELVWSHIY
jgi:hypothetical protein